MPGKQMAIDADLNTGQITDEEARRRRAEISQEADFYGAMDGASKFVKGDAMAGILITGINLIGGIVIGVMQQGMPFGEAAQHFSLLTVGDGLCAQIPALLISVATGILVTRSASEKDLGSDVAGQILEQRKAPLVAGAVIMCFALVPALPKIPFLVGGLFAVGWTLRKAAEQGRARPQPRLSPPPRASCPPPLRATPRSTHWRSTRSSWRSASAWCRWSTSSGRHAAAARRHDPPPDRLRARHGHPARPHPRRRRPGLHEYVMRVRGTEVARGGIMAGHHLAMDPGDAMGSRLGIPTTEPAFGLPAVWVPETGRAEAEALGWTVVDPESVVVTHLTETIRVHASELLTRQETRQLLDQLKEVNAAVVDEVVPTCCRSARSSACCSRCCARASPSATSARSSRRSATRRASPATSRCSPSTPARRSAARSSPRTWTARTRCARSRSTRRSSRRSPRSLVQTADGEFLAMDPVRAHALVDVRRAGRARPGPRRPPGDALLRPRAAPSAAPVGAAAPAARRLLLQRDRTRCQR